MMRHNKDRERGDSTSVCVYGSVRSSIFPVEEVMRSFHVQFIGQIAIVILATEKGPSPRTGDPFLAREDTPSITGTVRNCHPEVFA